MILIQKTADPLDAPSGVSAKPERSLSGAPDSAPRMQTARLGRRSLGFTLIEIMIVIAIMVILMGIAVPLYQQSLVRARESVLREDLYTLRNAIDQYTLDKQKAPQSLSDLTQAGYIKSIPKDPFTDSNDTWTTEMEDTLSSLDQQNPGIADVHSGSTKTASDGTAYNTW
jgi:general secretion pathway protein G